MAREAEQNSVQQMLQMMITMRMEDQKREQAREDTRERERIEQREKDDLSEERRQQEQARLLTTLRETQPAVPQRVTINNHKVPLMKEGDLRALWYNWKLHWCP